MGGILNQLTRLLKKFAYLLLQFFSVTVQCTIKFFKIQMQRCKRSSAQKSMAQSYSSLGAEVYSLYKQQETDWERMPLVQQQIKGVEEAEMEVVRVDENIERIKRDYQQRKEEIRAKYAEKRAQAGHSNEDYTSSE